MYQTLNLVTPTLWDLFFFCFDGVFEYHVCFTRRSQGFQVPFGTQKMLYEAMDFLYVRTGSNPVNIAFLALVV